MDEKEEEEASERPSPRPGAPEGALPLLLYPTGRMLSRLYEGSAQIRYVNLFFRREKNSRWLVGQLPNQELDF
jgi:hypothetical protein